MRKSKKQKQAFRDAVQSYVTELGFETNVEKGSMGSRNIVIGRPDSAKYLITAHYDTCARLPAPNLITPCNPLMFLLYQLFMVAVTLIPPLAVGAVIGWLTKDFFTGYMAGYFTLLITLFLMMLGPANRHNANDNTSGVVTLLEIARTLPENLRDKVCFVLFDLEEAGLIGSASYRKAHKAETQTQLVLNLDCVGDGDEIVLFPTRKLRRDTVGMAALDKISGPCGPKSIALHKKGFSVYPSDQRNFPLGVGIAAFHRKRGIGLYCSRIHTGRDRILEQTNVNILRAALITLVSGDGNS
ncbi:MAG: M28 family peptidase [Oscillospiraceae bacterium]|nr:M28 family peptidase [Oscillospiraceae bacterium]